MPKWIIRNEEKRWGWHVTSLERWTLRWLSTTRLRTQLIFRAYDTRRPLALTSCNPFPLRSPVVCTPTHPHPSSASHNLQHGRTGSRPGTRATPTGIHHATYDVRARRAQMRLRLGVHRAAGPQHPPFANIVASMLPLPGLARHASPHLAAPCYAGAAPLCCTIYRTPRNPKARPARLAALACIVCVCVGCVMLLSGRCASCFRVGCRLVCGCLGVVSAVALLMFSDSVSDAHVGCCSPSRLRMRGAVYALPVLVLVVCRIRSGRLSVAIRLLSLSAAPAGVLSNHTIHHTPHAHSPRNIHTPHTPHTTHTTLTPHTTRHSLLRIRKSGMVCS